jgi:hypothetical protein
MNAAQFMIASLSQPSGGNTMTKTQTATAFVLSMTVAVVARFHVLIASNGRSAVLQAGAQIAIVSDPSKGLYMLRIYF